MDVGFASGLVMGLALLPGVVGDGAYRVVIGQDWRERLWQSVVRVLGFSVAGVLVQLLFAAVGWLPLPVHVLPSSFTGEAFKASDLVPLGLSYSIHIVSSSVTASAWAIALRRLARATGMAVYPAAWDHFVRTMTPGRWVVVGLQTGEAVAGIVKHTDLSVKQDERDLVLGEPAFYDPKHRRYVATSYQYMFLPADRVASVSVILDMSKDTRVSSVGELLFSEPLKEATDGQEGTAGKTERGAEGRVESPSADSGA